MAQLAAREMQVVAGEDHAVGVRKDVYVDTERGVALEVENVALAVDLGDGRIGVAHHERVVGAVAVQAPVSVCSYSLYIYMSIESDNTIFVMHSVYI